MFKALADEGINIQMISTSEIKISVVIDEVPELAVRCCTRSSSWTRHRPRGAMAKPRVGIFGLGFGAQVHLPAFQSEGWDVAAVCSRHADKARAVAASAGVADICTDPPSRRARRHRRGRHQHAAAAAHHPTMSRARREASTCCAKSRLRWMLHKRPKCVTPQCGGA
jgi:hypothetical protein